MRVFTKDLHVRILMLFTLYLVFILLFSNSDASISVAVSVNAMIYEESSVRIMGDDSSRSDVYLWHV